jgi:extracellular factor (EF) 3-hydroxypalmitic acid methyl ester biosynthesis protein
MEDVVKESVVMFRTRNGVDLRGNPVRLMRHLAVLEIYSPNAVLQTSEVLEDFKIVWQDRTVYSGRAVVRNLLNAGTMTVCEATLDDAWTVVDLTPPALANGSLRGQVELFIEEWQKLYRVLPAYKIVIADFQTFLYDLRLWLDQVELGIRAAPSGDRLELERAAADRLAPPVVRAIDGFIERFEALAAGLPEELQPIHRAYLRRQLHPLLLCSPFAYRTYHKPLGYAGDYEMVDMMLRPPHEGGSLFAKVINLWLLGQMPVLAHRNRIDYLSRRLLELAAQAQARRQTVRVFNLGCGPAVEVQRFLLDHPAAERFRFTLLDFNEETLQHLRGKIEGVKRQSHRSTPVQLVKKSVQQVLKEAGRPAARSPENQYDLVCCAGLFDYLSDQVCKRLMNVFYDMLAPGGLLIATNVSDALNASRPFRYSMEYILDWHLIYRSGRGVTALAPEAAMPEHVTVSMEDTGVNIFIEVRKPHNA